MVIRKRILRRMGYLRDQQGIMNRYLREHSNWKEHLDRTQAFIRSSFPLHAPSSDPGTSVAVLGSGWLLDVPLEHLQQCFGKVYLVDIYHPPQIRKKVEKLENVILVEEDLSGGAVEQVYNFTLGKGPASPGHLAMEMKLTRPLISISPSATISLNLLNQLDILLCDYLSGHSRAGKEHLDQLRKSIQSFHLQWIMKNPGCLITDTREISIHKDGLKEVKSLLFTPLPPVDKKEDWTWEFDTSGSYRSGIRSVMEVEALFWN